MVAELVLSLYCRDSFAQILLPMDAASREVIISWHDVPPCVSSSEMRSKRWRTPGRRCTMTKGWQREGHAPAGAPDPAVLSEIEGVFATHLQPEQLSKHMKVVD